MAAGDSAASTASASAPGTGQRSSTGSSAKEARPTAMSKISSVDEMSPDACPQSVAAVSAPIPVSTETSRQPWRFAHLPRLGPAGPVATPTKVEGRPTPVEVSTAGRPMPCAGPPGEAAGMTMSHRYKTAIEVDRLRKSYGRKIAVDDVSFTVAEGEIFGLLGRNGAGKSTMVDCIVGLRTPDQGRIRIAGLDPRKDRRELRQLLGVQLQESQLQDKLTVAEAMRLYASFYRRPADTERLRRCWI